MPTYDVITLIKIFTVTLQFFKENKMNVDIKLKFSCLYSLLQHQL